MEVAYRCVQLTALSASVPQDGCECDSNTLETTMSFCNVRRLAIPGCQGADIWVRDINGRHYDLLGGLGVF